MVPEQSWGVVSVLFFELITESTEGGRKKALSAEEALSPGLQERMLT